MWAVSTVTMLVLAGVLPDFQLESGNGDSATRIAVTAGVGAAVFGLLSSLVWPLLVRALLLVPALVLGLLVFFLNGSLLLIALRINPSGQGEAAPQTTVGHRRRRPRSASATGGALAVRDDDAYRRRLYRLADRRRGRGDGRAWPSTPGAVFLQLDGVGHDVLREAVGKGLMPTVAQWLDGSGEGSCPTHRLTPWRTDWSSQTGASQLGILHGSNHDVPAFRWYEKDTHEVMVCNRPSSAELQRPGPSSTGDGACSPSTAPAAATSSAAAPTSWLWCCPWPHEGAGRTVPAPATSPISSDPANAVRTAMSFVAEVLREMGQSTAARIKKRRPRVKRGGLYPFVRAFATVVERDVVVAAVIGDMLAGRNVVYADLVAYDEVAHHSGPRSRDTEKVLERLDRSLALVAKVAEHAPRPYRIVVLSDHGQSPARPS